MNSIMDSDYGQTTRNASNDKSNNFETRLMVYHSLKCPVCSRHFDNEVNCFEHFLNYFDNVQYFLFNRCDLVFWFNKYVRTASEKVTMNLISLVNDENMNSLAELKVPTNQCEICFESFPNEDEIRIHSFSHFKVKVPAIDSQLKCPLCEKYFCHKEACLTHIFTHIKITSNKGTFAKMTTQKTFRFIKEWIIIFFCSKSCIEILAKYNRYKQRLYSPFLSKILLTEIDGLNKCKFCQNSITSVFDLLDDHRECKPKLNNHVDAFFCVLCNFKAIDMDTLILHFFSDHIVCYCGYTGNDFDSFIKHSKECTAHKNGIICPCCRISSFVTEVAFKKHIEETKSKSCGSRLKKNKWKCVICKMQCLQKDIFKHIVMNHVSCLCGYKSENMKSFFKHTSTCAVKKCSIFCPICHKVECSTKDVLQQHVCNCLPWKNSAQNKLHEEYEVGREVMKRKYEHVTLETFLKKTRFSLELNCVNCTSQ